MIEDDERFVLPILLADKYQTSVLSVKISVISAISDKVWSSLVQKVSECFLVLQTRDLYRQ